MRSRAIGTVPSQRGAIDTRSRVVPRMARDPDWRWDELLMERYLPVHWRFQRLFGVPADSSTEGLYAWCLAVLEAVREVLGPHHERSIDMERIRHRLYRAELIVGRKREQRMRAAVWTHRCEAHLVLQLAAEEEVTDRSAIRIVDMHPWVAEPAAPRFDTDRHAAVLMAAANVEARWREHLAGGTRYEGLASLAESFKPDRQPTQDSPVLRFLEYVEATSDWKNAHDGAFFYGRGCAMRIRNLLAHRADVPISRGYALELLGALSLLARWVESAEVVSLDPNPQQ